MSNFQDIKDAPPLQYKTVLRGRNRVPVQVHDPYYVFTVRKKPFHCTMSYQLPDGRWSMYTKDSPPTHFVDVQKMAKEFADHG